MVAALLWKEKLHPSCQSIQHSESLHGGKNFPPIVNYELDFKMQFLIKIGTSKLHAGIHHLAKH